MTPLRKGEITALVMPPEGVSKGPCNTSNPSYITACFGDTAALTLSCVPPGQDKGVAPPGRRLPSSLPTQQGKWPFLRGLLTPREARIGETQIPFALRRQPQSLCASVSGNYFRGKLPRGSGPSAHHPRAALKQRVVHRNRNLPPTAPSSLLWARKQAALAQTKNAISSFLRSERPGKEQRPLRDAALGCPQYPAPSQPASQPGCQASQPARLPSQPARLPSQPARLPGCPGPQ